MDLTKLHRALTVEELIEELQTHPPKSKVVFQHDYGDIGHTQELLTVESADYVDSVGRLYASAYSGSGIAVEPTDKMSDEELEDFENDTAGIDLVILGTTPRGSIW